MCRGQRTTSALVSQTSCPLTTVGLFVLVSVCLFCLVLLFEIDRSLISLELLVRLAGLRIPESLLLFPC